MKENKKFPFLEWFINIPAEAKLIILGILLFLPLILFFILLLFNVSTIEVRQWVGTSVFGFIGILSLMIGLDSE